MLKFSRKGLPLIDKWSGFADLLANLIEKYAAVLDIDNLPDPRIHLDSDKKEDKNDSKLQTERHIRLIITILM